MGYYLGIDLGGTNIKAGVVDDEFRIVGRAKAKTGMPRPAEEVMDAMAECAGKAAEDAGFTIYVATAYRTYGHQNNIFNLKASTIAEGMGVYDYMDPKYQDAVAIARTITAFPGSSEHQLGLAVDLMDRNYSSWVYENMNQEFFAWLDEHCAEYGFIKRYPTKKLLLTGWDEPWHYRFVGVEAATFIMEHDLCYEEFYAHYHPDFSY